MPILLQEGFELLTCKLSSIVLIPLFLLFHTEKSVRSFSMMVDDMAEGTGNASIYLQCVSTMIEIISSHTGLA